MNTQAHNNHSLRSKVADGVIMTWYATLQSEHKNAERAQLRRCETLDQVFWHREYYSLLQQLEEAGVDVRSQQGRGRDETALAAICGLLAHVKVNRGGTRVGRQLAMGTRDKRGLSDLRFRRLLASQTPTEALPYFRRALHILDGEIDVARLIGILSKWMPDSEYDRPSANPRVWLAEEFYSAPRNL